MTQGVGPEFNPQCDTKKKKKKKQGKNMKEKCVTFFNEIQTSLQHNMTSSNDN